MFLKESYGAFVKGVYQGMPLVFLVIVQWRVCKFKWSYGVVVFFFFTFFGKFVYFSIFFNVSMCSYFV